LKEAMECGGSDAALAQSSGDEGHSSRLPVSALKSNGLQCAGTDFHAPWLIEGGVDCHRTP
jgi:hypothetical protein